MTEYKKDKTNNNFIKDINPNPYYQKNTNNKSSLIYNNEIDIKNILNNISIEIKNLTSEITIVHQKNKLRKIDDIIKTIISNYDNINKTKDQVSSNSFLNNTIDNKSYTNNKNLFKEELNNSDNIINNTNNINSNNTFIKKSRSKIDDPINHIKLNLEQENFKLKEELSLLKKNLTMLNIKAIDNNLSDNTVFNKQEEQNNVLTKKIEVLQYTINEERESNRELILQTQRLEDALKKLNNEYNSLCYRFAKLKSESEVFEKTITDLKHNLAVNKNKIEEVIKINNELKSKHFEKEQFIDLHNKDIKNVIRKNQKLNIKLEESEKKVSLLTKENECKEIRLKSLRDMNTKLDYKANEIFKKWNKMQEYKKQIEETYESYQKQLDYIEEKNKQIMNLKNVNDNQHKLEDKHKKEIIRLEKLNKEYKEQIDNLLDDNNSMEIKLKNFEKKANENKYVNTLNTSDKVNIGNNNTLHNNKLNILSSTYNTFAKEINQNNDKKNVTLDSKNKLNKKNGSNNMNTSGNNFNISNVNASDNYRNLLRSPIKSNFIDNNFIDQGNLALDEIAPVKFIKTERKIN